jgi:hypothetical protein
LGKNAQLRKFREQRERERGEKKQEKTEVEIGKNLGNQGSRITRLNSKNHAALHE